MAKYITTIIVAIILVAGASEQARAQTPSSPIRKKISETKDGWQKIVEKTKSDEELISGVIRNYISQSDTPEDLTKIQSNINLLNERFPGFNLKYTGIKDYCFVQRALYQKQQYIANRLADSYEMLLKYIQLSIIYDSLELQLDMRAFEGTRFTLSDVSKVFETALETEDNTEGPVEDQKRWESSQSFAREIPLPCD